MKKCSYCGFDNPDEAVQCLTCHTSLISPPRPPNDEDPERTEYVVTPAERRFWERATFREFAVLFIRIQALWLFFYAVVDLTYLPRYVSRFHEAYSYSSYYG